MGKSAQQPNGPPDAGRAYTKRLRWVAELRFVAFYVAVLGYSLAQVHKWVAAAVEGTTTNFYLQIALCWIPLWLVCTVASFPVSLYCFHIARNFQVVKLDLFDWVWDFLKASAVGFILGGTIIQIAFAVDSVEPAYGWIAAGILCSLLFVAVNRSIPWLLSLFYPVVPLSDIHLHEKLGQLAIKAGLPVGPIYEWRISKRTRAANALVAGVGSVRRILLTDTLIAALTAEEVESIVAHELGHCALHHIRKRLLLQSLIFIVILGIINFAVRIDLIAFVDENKGWRDLRLLPGFFLYWNLAYIWGHMLLSSLSRKQEKAADLYSWNLMGRAAPFITAMRKLSDLNLIVFDKDSAWRYMHPPIADRLAAAEKFAKEQGETVGAPGAAATMGLESS
ncbi:MAG TPA: M48 family metalloprotease [Candidatus Acidoferrum sp.]|nr:M48 family metalloprotease [Candidatus Acidoferrum sp.]